uniref:Uncharacterized protein n=1 Tax=Anopheles merus TaxID=30066 RepID=A0A182VJM7_ANOME
MNAKEKPFQWYKVILIDRRTSPSAAAAAIARSTLLLLPPYRSPAAELFQDRLNRPLDSRGFGSPVGPASSSGHGSSSRPSFSTFTVCGTSLARASFSLAESSMYSPFSSSWPKSYELASGERVGSSGVRPRMQSMLLRLSRSSSLRVRSLRSLSISGTIWLCVIVDSRFESRLSSCRADTLVKVALSIVYSRASTAIWFDSSRSSSSLASSSNPLSCRLTMLLLARFSLISFGTSTNASRPIVRM